MSAKITDEQIQQVSELARPFSLVQLRWTADRHKDGADAIELEHQRRMVGLRADGVIAILCPVLSDTLAGMAVMTVTPEQAEEIMAGDPCVQGGMMTCEVFPCVSFPGDTVPG